MSAPAVRYSEPPTFVMHYPTCSACSIDLDHDGDGWTCPKCETAWDTNASDGDEGELWESYSGESFDEDVEPMTHDEGFKAPWIRHAYEPWVTDGGLDMLACRKCYGSKREHLGGAA